MPAAEFVAMASAPNVLGSPLLKTQHFIGGSRWEKVSDTEVIGYHQLRVPHQKYAGDGKGGLGEVKVKGHAHSHNTHWYRKVDGVWKFAGLNPDIRWAEYDFDKVFEEGRNDLGDSDAQDETKVSDNENNEDNMSEGKTEVGYSSGEESKDLAEKAMGVPPSSTKSSDAVEVMEIPAPASVVVVA